jgi:quinol monooxygenase YgiN
MRIALAALLERDGIALVEEEARRLRAELARMVEGMRQEPGVRILAWCPALGAE